MEAADKEQQEADKQTHKNNIEAQKRTNQILKEELEKLLQGPQQGKKWSHRPLTLHMDYKILWFCCYDSSY